MPQQHLSSEEIDNLLAFFKWVDNIDTHDWPPQDSKKRMSSATKPLIEGATLSPGALFKESGCFDCHKLGGTGGDGGPALDNVGLKFDKETLEKIIANPQAVNPEAQMPGSELPGEQVEKMAEFLAKQRGDR
jgi:cytochrome c551/c552